MKIKNSLFLVAGSCLLFLAACQSSNDQLVQKWQVESFQSPMRDSMLKMQEQSIDTMSQVDTNMAKFYGTSNLDSLKILLKGQIESQKKLEADAAKQSAMEFLKDSIVIMYNGVQIDSAKWVLSDDKKQLTFSPLNPTGPEKAATFDIITLTSNSLQLKMTQGNNSMQINLRPFTKEDSVSAAKLNEEQLKEQLARQQMQQQMQQAAQDSQPDTKH